VKHWEAADTRCEACHGNGLEHLFSSGYGGEARCRESAQLYELSWLSRPEVGGRDQGEVPVLSQASRRRAPAGPATRVSPYATHAAFRDSARTLAGVFVFVRPQTRNGP